MTDIVNKLRDRKQAIAWSRGMDTDYPTKWEPDALCQKAADEIETLRTQLAHWKVFAEHAEGERSRLKHNEGVMMNALYKACGDDEEMVRQIIESQGVLRCEPELLK